MLIIHRSEGAANHAAIPAALLCDDRLSYSARGVLAELLSRADGLETNADAISERARRHRAGRGEGRRAVRAIFAELEAAGYMRRSQRRQPSGAFYTILEVSDVPYKWGSVGTERAPFPAQRQAAVVYAIGQADSGIVKIGTTENIKARLRAIQNGSPQKLHVRWQFGGDTELENFLHVRFADLRLEGEWFNFGDDDPVEAISAAADAYYLVPLGTCASW